MGDLVCVLHGNGNNPFIASSVFFWSEPNTRTSWQGSAMTNRCDSRYSTFISNPAGSCVGAFWSQSGDWNRALARQLVLGAVTFICTICFWHRQRWPGTSKVRNEDKATGSVGLRVQIWEMGRGRMRFNLSTNFLNTFVVFKLIQIPTWPSSYNFNALSAVTSACSNLLMKRICGSRRNLYRSRRPWDVVSWSLLFS